jgi:hypothetical protein
MKRNNLALWTISIVAAGLLFGLLAGCGGDNPSGPPARPAVNPCPYEDLSTWQGGEGAWPKGMRFYLQFINGCEDKATAVNIATANPYDRVRLFRKIEVPPDTLVRMVATLDLLEGVGALRIEVRDTGVQFSEIAEQNPNGFAEIRFFLPTGHGEVAIQADALVDHGIAVGTISNVIVETR